MVQHISILIGVMTFFGILGGIINYFFGKQDETTITKSITIGIAASFLVPLFLNMISSDLISSSKDDPYKILIFTGFCLIASISSSAFIGSISERVLKEVKEAKEKVTEVVTQVQQVKDQASVAMDEVKSVKETVEPLTLKGTEQEYLDDEVLDKNCNLNLSDDEKNVLMALSNSGYTYRSMGGVKNDTNLDKVKINTIINKLISEGLVGQANRTKGIRWFITEEGRKVVFLVGQD
ncbi:YEATS-associated helix-containing protein [Cellulosilyticum sp. I15G10I2]|uniref:YEATS-associated helix-containing protein n=1 Tax=Cellulosilyticum sp. I15G10I2 TaxID=1892843 RepID=UPI00085C5BA6|nr:YEATS-associated helix-containing protein [Cellulosilyticum sp. I15G10I2]